jgi:hypothetical protein
MIDKLVELCFSDWQMVKTWLQKQEIEIEETDTIVCKNPKHGITVGFDWDTLDLFTRGHQLQFLLFGGRHFLELSTLIEKRYRERKKAGKK